MQGIGSTQDVAADGVTADVRKSVELALLDLLARQSRRMPIPIFLTASLMGVMAYDAMGVIHLSVWLIVVLGILLLRLAVLPRLPARSDLPTRTRLHIATVLSLLNGIAHSVPVYYFVDLPDFERSVITISLMGFAAGSVGTTAGYRPVYVAYLAPTLLPLVGFWGVAQGGGFDVLQAVIALLLLVFGVIVLSLSQDTFRQFSDSIEIRLEQTALNERLRAALKESQTASAAKTRFLAAASHDLRQPVHALKLFTAGLGSMAALPADARDVVGHMKLALTTFDAQLDALLDIARLEAGVVEVHPESFDLVALLERVRSQFEPLAREKGLELRVNAPAEAFARTDPRHLRRILDNLVSNAVKYTSQGSVVVRLSHTGRGLELAVADTGRGIPAPEQERVFEDFYQLHNPSRDRAKGLGLGLGNARRYADLLGIPLSLQSEEGVGTTFELVVPAGEHAPTAVPADEVTSLAGLHLLVVDDDPGVLHGMRVYLTSQGCSVDTAVDQHGATERAQLRRPDALICDFRLAGSDSGLCTIDRVRQLYPALPALLVTGDTAPDRLREAAEADVLLLHKPVGEEALTRAIAQAIRPEARS